MPGTTWVIPQLRWLHELERVCPLDGPAPDPFAPAPRLDYALPDLADRPDVKIGQRVSGLRRHPLSMEVTRNRLIAWTALLGEDDQAGFIEDLAAVAIGVSHRGQLGKAAGEMGVTGWLEAVLSWPRRFIVGADDLASLPGGTRARPGRRIASADMSKLPLRARLATSIGGAAGRVSRLTGRGDGSVIGGVLGLRVEPDLLRLLAADRQVVLVTGTNGKTTTTRLITAALGALGQDVASNAFGANMEAGLASALGRAPDAPYAVLETDERYLPAVIEATKPARRRAAQPQPRPDGPGRGDLADRAAMAAGPGEGRRLHGHRERRRPADRLGGVGGAAGHLGRGGPALARGLLVLPGMRLAPAPGRAWLALRRVRASPGRRLAGY